MDIQVSKIDSQTDDLLCPSRPASVPLRHAIASSALASQHSLKWLDSVLDAYAASPLALAHDGYLQYTNLGASTFLRYTLWTNLELQIRVLREMIATWIYKLRGWI